MGIKMLFKNTLKTFNKKKFQLVSVAIIIFLSSFLYTTMFYAMDGLKRPMERMMEKNKQEDFSINMINALNSFEIQGLLSDGKEKYITYSLSNIKNEDKELYDIILNKRKNLILDEYKGYDLELREFKDINFTVNGEGKKIRVFKEGKNINLSLIEEGNKPEKNNEIAINRVYAEKNSLNIGDTININNKEYKITGFVDLPDFNMPIMGNDFIIDNSKITIGILTDEEYESISGKEDFYFAGLAKNKSTLDNFKEEVIEDFNHKKENFKNNGEEDLSFITSIVSTKNQVRSGAIYEELKGGKFVTLGISIIISSIAVMMVAIITYKILKNEKSQIGVLKALGYSKYEIAVPYILLLLIIALPTLILGYIGGTYAAVPMKNLYLDFYLLPNEAIQTNYIVFLTAIIVPLVFIMFLSSLIIMRMLSKKAINLLKAQDKEKIGVLNKISGKLLRNCKAQTKYKYSYIFRNTGKFILFFIGISFSSMLITMGLMMVGFFDKMTVDYYDSVKYQYEGYIDMSKDKVILKSGEEKFLDFNMATYNKENISLKGIDYDNKLHKLYNSKEEDITENLKNGVIVNKSFSKIYNIKKGDTINIEINNKNYEEKVLGISKDYGDNKIYLDRNYLSEILVESSKLNNINKEDLFTGVYSEKNLEKDRFLSVVNKEDILNQISMMQGFIKISIYSMVFSAIFIATLILYVLTTLTIEDNYYNISLLKVMGYSRKEVNSMMLNSYLIYAIISYLINIPVTLLYMTVLTKYMGTQFNMVFPFEFKLYQGIIGMAIVIIIFLGGSYAAKKRVEKISLQEVLKAYRE